MANNQSPQLVAGGNISPSVFVKVSASADNTGLAASNGDRPIGISQVGPAQPPGVTGSDSFAAHAGEEFQLFGIGDICLLKAGSAVCWTSNDLLMPSAANDGGTTASSGNWAGAIALSTQAANTYGRVQVLSPYKVP